MSTVTQSTLSAERIGSRSEKDFREKPAIVRGVRRYRTVSELPTTLLPAVLGRNRASRASKNIETTGRLILRRQSRRMFAALKLKDYKELSEEEARLTGGEALDICIEIGSRCLSELGFLAVHESMTAEELAAKHGVSIHAIREDDFRRLRDHGLIVTVPSLGAVITTRGLRLVRWVKGTEGAKLE